MIIATAYVIQTVKIIIYRKAFAVDSAITSYTLEGIKLAVMTVRAMAILLILKVKDPLLETPTTGSSMSSSSIRWPGAPSSSVGLGQTLADSQYMDKELGWKSTSSA